MGREDQAEEREVLESIFPDEITDLSETEFRISVTLDLPDTEAADAPGFLLQVRYPEDYPDVAPHLDILAPPNATVHPLFSVADDRDNLLAGLEETIQESLGMAMVFTLVSALKEAAEQLVQERKDEATKKQEELLLAAEREENKKFHGTPVTAETFLSWRRAFQAEMKEKERQEEEERLAELKKTKTKEPTKLTGRQLWERGLAGKVEEGDDDETDPMADGIPTEGMGKIQLESA